MVDSQTRAELVEFLKSKNPAVLSTISSSGQPMSATLYFTFDEYMNFYFMTKSYTRKHANLQQNSEVALVIGTENTPATVQIQGKAARITDVKEFDLWMGKLRDIFFKDEFVAPLFQMSPKDNEIVIYKVVPSWIRWLVLRGEKTNGGFTQIL